MNKNIFCLILLGVLICIVIPNIIFSYAGTYDRPVCTFMAPESATELTASPDTQILQEQQCTELVKKETFTVTVLDHGKPSKMDLEAYVEGVVLGEMPVNFHKEALKAQAVVARTFALRRSEKKDKHPSGAVCTDPACCQAYISPETFESKGGTMEQINKIKDCVASTSGEVLMYDGEYIEATYFSSSGGRTEDAVAVWGMDVPYLQAIDCPGEADMHEESFILSAGEFARILDLPDTDISVDDIDYTEGNGVNQIRISGKTFTGCEIRNLLHLDSTMFSVSAENGYIFISSRGYGHRVGMSQYGADAMAKKGMNYKEILSYFYPGAYLSEIRND